VLDSLAAEGLRFIDGYANSPVCSPTRFALATDRWQYWLRGGADELIANRSARASPVLGLPPGHPTMASLLCELRNRYAAWHASMPPIPPTPRRAFLTASQIWRTPLRVK
jgi:arylsulfatase A-like enzyme